MTCASCRNYILDLLLLKENATSLNLPWLQPIAGSVQASLNLRLLLDEVVESVWHPELLNSHPHEWTVKKARFPYRSSEWPCAGSCDPCCHTKDRSIIIKVHRLFVTHI